MRLEKRVRVAANFEILALAGYELLFSSSIGELLRRLLLRGGQGVTVSTWSSVPEPSTWAMMLLGFAGLGFASYRSQ
jgi:hypothetical protein